MWALGCTMAEMIVRRPIFPGNDASQTFEMIRNITTSFDSKFISHDAKRLKKITKKIT